MLLGSPIMCDAEVVARSDCHRTRNFIVFKGSANHESRDECFCKKV